MREATAKVESTESKKFELNTQWIPISVLVLASPVIIMSIQAFYKVDRAAQDIVNLTNQVENIKTDVADLGNDAARTEAKLDFLTELLKEVRENQKKGI